MTRTLRIAWWTLTLVLLAALPASAGTVSVAWDPVADADVAGYRVYYGTSAGNYTQNVDVGNVTSTTLSGLTDCQVWYVGVKAYDTAGNLSTSYSNEVSGWPRPVVTSSNPAAAEQGRTLVLTISGTNFQSGASVQFSNAGITVNSVSVTSCSQLTANVTVGASAPVGASNIDVTNPDLVFGTGVGLFTVQAAAAPTVQSTNPTDGATGISISVQPTVTFSEAMLASSITATTVRLLDDTGAAVAQAAGSPSLSANGLTATIAPSANLQQGKTYKIQVVGGATGVKDLANNPMAATFTQTTGFSTVADTTAPVISAVASSAVASTTATITWTTDEASDSQVFYREQGETAYQQTAIDATKVTSHSVGLQGLAPSTTYEYYVRSADAAGNASTSTPIKTFVTLSNTNTYLRFEAETGTVVAPVRSVSAAGVFGDKYIDTPSGTGNGSATSPSGTSTYGINVPSAGTWYLWIRLYAIDASRDSWFESINGAARQSVASTAYGQWKWVAGRSYTLSAGLATLELGGRRAEARVDRILLTNDASFVPTEQSVGDTTPPAPVTGFTGTPGTAQVTLAWTNPTTTDYAHTVIRYRTDGKYPVSPVDGFAVADKNAAPGAADSFVHTGLANGTTYNYSAFAVDATGNVSAVSATQATPTDITPPSPVANLRRADKK